MIWLHYLRSDVDGAIKAFHVGCSASGVALLVLIRALACGTSPDAWPVDYGIFSSAR